MAKQKSLPEGLTQRSKVYWAEFRVGGRRIRKSLSRNLKTAKQLLTELRARAERGEFGLLDNDYPVEDLRVQYLHQCRQILKADTVQRYEYNLAAIVPALPRRIAQIRIDTVLAYRDQRLAAGTSPRTINMDVGALSAMLNWGAKHEVIDHNPIRGIAPLPHDHPKEGRPLTGDEVDRLLAASPPQWRDIWYCLLVTGMRKSELAHLRFSDIDWEARELIVRRGISKNHKARQIPIENGLWERLCQQRDGRRGRRPGNGRSRKITGRVQGLFTRDHVFVTTENTPLTHGSGLYYAFMRCCKLARIQTRTVDANGHEIDHVDVHSLRRTFATDLIVSGADPKTVQELLGHKTLAMTMNLYAKIHTGTKRQALGRLSYGAGIRGPEHVVELPEEAKVGHDLSTVPMKAATGST